jgi:hypothetical protein
VELAGADDLEQGEFIVTLLRPAGAFAAGRKFGGRHDAAEASLRITAVSWADARG